MGIDPGVTGAVAIRLKDRMEVIDTPTFKIKKGKGYKTVYDESGLVKIIKSTNVSDVYLEKVHAMPKQGVSSMFNMGYGLGVLVGIIRAVDIPLHWVTPQAWKKKILSGMQKGKGSAVVKASELYPYLTFKTPRGRMLDGRGDAVCICEYGVMEQRGEA